MLLTRQVLVLNRLWQAVNVCSVERAMALLVSSHAQVVTEEAGVFSAFRFEDWCRQPIPAGEEGIGTVSMKLRVPTIILLGSYDRLPRREVRFSRQNIFARDRHTCQYCNQRFDMKFLNLDHVVPRQQGGPTTWTNIVCSCLECNRKKANRTPEQAGMRLRRKPARPRWRPFIKAQFSRRVYDSWKHFVDLAYWNVEMG